jgi:hypothetical protein
MNSIDMNAPSKIRSRPSLLNLAFGDGTAGKALATAALIGSLLIVINHGDIMLSGEFPSPVKVILTYFVPYCVTTWGAMIGKRAQWEKDRETI